MANANYFKYLGVAGLIAMAGCSVGAGDETTEPSTDDKAPVANPEQEGVESSEDALHTSILMGRWRFNETGQRVEDSAGNHASSNTFDVDGFLGRLQFSSDANDPQRVSGGHPHDDDSFNARFLRFNLRVLTPSSNVPPLHDFVTIRSSTSNFSRLQPGRISVESWVRPQATTQTGYVVSKGAHNDCNAGSYSIYVGAGRVHFLVRIGTGVNDFREASWPIGTGADWKHVVGTYDGLVVRLYVNGVLRDSVQTGSALPRLITYNLNKHNNLYFGAYNEDPTLQSTDCQLPYIGAVDEVRIWRGALNAANVMRRYQGQEPITILDSDNDGVPNDRDICPNTPPGVLVGPFGCPLSLPDADTDGVPNDRDACPNTIGNFPNVSPRGCDCAQVEAMLRVRRQDEPVGTQVCPIMGVCYNNHGQYVSCVSQRLDDLEDDRFATDACADLLQTQAAQSPIGQPGHPTRCDD